VALLRLLVHVVRLPHVVQVLVAGVVALEAEALDVEAVLVGVHTQARQVDHQRRDALTELAPHRRSHEPDRLLALVVGVVGADPGSPRGHQARQAVDLGGGLSH
jgi:hypothetical protein